jgi:hypothetical protein
VPDEVVDDEGYVGVGGEVSEVQPLLAADRVDVPADLHNALLAIDDEPGRDDVGPAVAIGRGQPADALLAQVGEFVRGERAYWCLRWLVRVDGGEVVPRSVELR